jgi:hypothetical protein
MPLSLLPFKCLIFVDSKRSISVLFRIRHRFIRIFFTVTDALIYQRTDPSAASPLLRGVDLSVYTFFYFGSELILLASYTLRLP